MEIFNPGQDFNLLNWVEISSRLNSKPLFKMTLQLHVKISAQYTELQFQLGLAKPRWNFNPEWKFQIFHVVDIFFNPGWKFDTSHTWISCLYLKITHMWRRWGSPQNFFLALIEELEKQIIIKKTVEVGQ